MEDTYTTIVSAPGKVLMAGGYLVLDRQYSGLVVATSSRFYCAVKTDTRSEASVDSATITVRAGQFPKDSSTWSYRVSRDKGELRIEQIGENGRNKFVEITLVKALQVAQEVLASERGGDGRSSGESSVDKLLSMVQGMDIVVVADNDFYSQREQLAELSLPPLYSSLECLTPFSPLPRPIHQTNKTGLGSSAGLVTSLTAGILAHLGVVDIPTTDSIAGSSSTSSTGGYGIDLVHTLAQLSHCIAQGKIGSGFDVSSAVFGTHIYKRFSPTVLTPLMADNSRQALLPTLTSEEWDHQTKPFRLPKGLRLMLADVDAGTDTPSFVGKVLKWREADTRTADELWGQLGNANDNLGELLQQLAQSEEEEGYTQVLAQAKSVPTSKLEIAHLAAQLLVRISAALTLIRSYLQKMSSLSSVPIEPPEQTRLLDQCCALPGVIGGGVPGAGGFDAIFLLAIDSPEVIKGVENVWASWTEMSVCPLSARQSDGGLVRETGQVRGLAEALARVNESG